MKDTMAERTEDLTLPNAVIARIIKDSLPEGVSVSKEARSAIAKSASVFVLYATSTANNLAQKNKKKTVSGQDVLTAMKEMEFERFIEPLQESLEVHKRSQQSKKEQKEAKAKAKKAEEEKKKDLEDGNTPMEQDSVPSIATEVEKETELDGTL
ncbi:DNA polymerase epsilon subunit 3-like isoform X2 [Oratosquilla oratoria]|uniref:DNA polymerase epsilon subunit 3-like isoform X2 n=1 Tax=Oratosquilla oratoria TaxID=337810 RepID=UPI003F77220F